MTEGKMINQRATICGVIFLLCVSGYFAQMPERWFNIAILVDKTTFAPRRAAQVKVRFKAEYVQPFRVKTPPQFLYFHLSKKGAALSKCEDDDCFTTAVPLVQDIKENEPIEFEIDLNDLDWNFPGDNPKNTFEKVPPGKYFLFAELKLENKHSFGEIARRTVIKSNAISIKISKPTKARNKTDFSKGAAESLARDAQNITGSYESGSNSLDVLRLLDNRVKFYLFAMWKSPANGEVSHFGEVCAVVPLIDNTAIYESGECRIKMKFAGRKVTVTQIGNDADCGFGANVTADGVYRKRSSRVPKFEMCDF